MEPSAPNDARAPRVVIPTTFADYSPTCVIDLSKVVSTIHESTGSSAGPIEGTPEDLLGVIVEEAQALRQSHAQPDLITPVLVEKIGHGADSALGRAAMACARLAGEAAETHPTYHNAQHVTEVILAAASLGLREHLPADRIAELVVAAAAHDLGHTGGVNSFPFELETRSYELAYPALVEAGLDEGVIRRIGQMIVSTDFVNGVPKVRENYLYHQQQGANADPEELMLAAQCLIITEADILFSCFNETYNDMLSSLLSVEWNRPNLSYKERIGFLSSVQFLSEAARQLRLDERRLEIISRLKVKLAEQG